MNREKIESVIRSVLLHQLGIDAQEGDNLIGLDPDMPTDEILKDALELIGGKGNLLEYESWDGSLSGLVDIIWAAVDRDQRGKKLTANSCVTVHNPKNDTTSE
jgi:hypothetical protein